MSKLAQLREARTTKAKAVNDINAKYSADQRMPAADSARMDELMNEIEAIDAEITREQRVANLAADQLINNPQAAHEHALNAATNTRTQHGAGASDVRDFLRGGVQSLSDEQRTALRARQTPDIMAAMNPSQIYGAMSTNVPAEGGYTVAPEFSRTLEVALRSYGAMLGVGTTVRTASGAQMSFPTGDPASEEGEIVGQSAPANSGDTTFGNILLAVYRYSSKKIALPWELVQDSGIDIEAYIQDLLGMRLGRVRGKHTTIADGINKPMGIVPAAAVGKIGAGGQVTSVGYDDFVDLEHSVDPAYRGLPGVGYMMHDSSLQRVRKLKDSSGRPIFVPGYEQGNPGGAPDRLMNRPLIINQDMPVMGASAKSILYGAFSKYFHREVMDLTLFRFTDSAFTLNGQIGFCAFQRCGGNLIDVGGAVKAYQNSAV